MTSLLHPNWKLKNIQSSKSSLEDIGYLNSSIKNSSLRENYENTEWNTSYFHKKELHFNKDPWNYYINKYNYRGDNWTFKKVPAFFGCSFTFGIGVETPFPALIQKQYSDDTVIPNIGIPGGSSIAIIKSFIAFANLHPMSHAFISLPQIDRYHHSVMCEDKWMFDQIIPNALVKDKLKSQKRILSMWMGDMSRAFTTDYIDWAEAVAESKGIKLFWSSWDNETHEFIKPLVANNFDWPPSHDKKGRDGAHPGVDVHKDMADRVWSIIND